MGLVLCILFVILAARKASCNNCSSNTARLSPEGLTPKKCIVEYELGPKGQPSRFKIGEKNLKFRSLYMKIKSKNVSSAKEECTVDLNVKQILKKLPHYSVTIQQVVVDCRCPAKVSFCRPENFTAFEVILYLRVLHCRVTGADLAVWGRAVDLRVLYLIDAVLQDNDETRADLDGLFNVGSLAMNLKNKTIPKMFLRYVWEKMAEVQLREMSLHSNLNIFKTTMPNLQSLELSRNTLDALPDFPWCNRRLELPRNLSRISGYNEQYSESATINPRTYRRFFTVHFMPLRPKSFAFAAGKLDKISFRGSGCKSLNSTTFDKVTNLKILDLSHNKLNKIPEEIFKKNPDLVWIKLQNNNLTSLDGKVFKGLKNLRKLNVGNNSIDTLRNGFFSDKFEKLEELNFQNTSLRIVEETAFPLGVFDSLKKINFAQNKLRTVPQFGFYVRNLELFDMSNNQVNFTGFIEMIDALYLSDFLFVHGQSGSSIEAQDRLFLNAQKKTLDLQSNAIARIDLTDFDEERLKILELVLRVFKIILKGNPIHCDCKTRDLQLRLLNWSKTAKEIDEEDFDSWVCQTPSNLHGKKILSVPPQECRCKSRSPKCPPGCTCYRSYYDSPIFVDCRRRGLTALPETLPNGNVELHVEYNKIKELNFTKSMENVTLFYASHNKLKRVNLMHSPLNLKEIHLDSNKLTTLPKNIQNLTLSRINLQHNFFACDCNNFWMKNWLKRQEEVFIGGSETVSCSSGDNQAKSLVLVQNSDFVCKERVGNEPNITTSIPAISAYAVAGFLFALLVSTAILNRFRKELKLVLYTRFNWHPFDRVDDSDPSKTYDAFVSFNKQDLLWVMETLRHKLENDDPPYKLCIHCRDFIPGATVADNILDSVKTSRRMIMILSQHFIQSEWCMLEFRAAHRRVLKGRANYLIVVLFDDVDVDNLDEELSLYLKTNTYLSVSSKWFWQQLKYALPQKRLGTSDTRCSRNKGPELNEASCLA